MPWKTLDVKPLYPTFRVIAIPAVGGIPDSTWGLQDPITSIRSCDTTVYNALKNEAYIHFYTFPEGSSSRPLGTCADDLLLAIKDLLSENDKLPIHFAAYSTGGIVLKFTITRATSDLANQFHSVAFFGVPHHGSSVIPDVGAIGPKQLGEVMWMAESVVPMRGHFTRDKSVLELCNPLFLQCSQKLRRIWNFVETEKTIFQAPDALKEGVAAPAKPKSGLIVDVESAKYSAADIPLLNEVTVNMKSNHAGLPHFQSSDANAQDYIRELKSFVVEFNFPVDVHLFAKNMTDLCPLHVMPTLTDFLRDGPTQCLKKMYPNDSFWCERIPIPDKNTRPRLQDSIRAIGSTNASRRELLRSDMLKERGFRWIHVPCNHMSWVPMVLFAAARDSMEGLGPVEAKKRLGSLLDWEWWESKQNIPPHGLPHARFMEPYCRVFPTEKMEESFEKKNLAKAKSGLDDVQLLLYMPYLHWDRLDNLKSRTEIIEHAVDQLKTETSFRLANLFAKQPSPESILFHESKPRRKRALYRLLNLSNNLPLHPRRSLDQFGHPYLKHISARDEDQVLLKCNNLIPHYQSDGSRKGNAGHESILMVDQLWCWIIDSSTIVTFFSGTDGALESMEKLAQGQTSNSDEEFDPADVRQLVFDRLTDHPRIPAECKTSLDFVSTIVLTAISVLLESSARTEAYLSRQDLHVFSRFEEYISYWHEKQTKKCKDFEKTHQSPGDLRITLEDTLDTNGYIELLDVKDESSILLKLMKEQLYVINRLNQYYSCVGYPMNHQGGSKTAYQHRLLAVSSNRIERYTSQLRCLEQASDAARESYKTLFDMRQVQANLSEVLYAGKDNRALMVFTIATVVFSPLSFFTSLFGVNSYEWNGANGSPSTLLIMLVTFLVSGIIVLVALYFAFPGYRPTVLSRAARQECEKKSEKAKSDIQASTYHNWFHRKGSNQIDRRHPKRPDDEEAVGGLSNFGQC